MSLVGEILAGDAVDIDCTMTPSTGVDGTDVDSVRVMVTGPGDTADEWTATLGTTTETSVAFTIELDGTVNATQGEYKLRAFFYDATSVIIDRSRIERITIKPNPVANPT